MKIDTSEKFAYDAVADEVLRQSGGMYTTYIIDLWTSNLGGERVLLMPTGDGQDFEFDTDWYEGGDVELLGWAFLDDVFVPRVDGEGETPTDFPFWQTGDPPLERKWYMVKDTDGRVDVDLWAEWDCAGGVKKWSWAAEYGPGFRWAGIPKG